MTGMFTLALIAIYGAHGWIVAVLMRRRHGRLTAMTWLAVIALWPAFALALTLERLRLKREAEEIKRLKEDVIAKAKANGAYLVPRGFVGGRGTTLQLAMRELQQEGRITIDFARSSDGFESWVVTS